MTVQIQCPCCLRPWRVSTADDLPPFLLRKAALEFVARETGIREAAIRCRRRSRELVAARAAVVWAVKSFGPADLGYSRIGRWLNRDHSTVRHLWLEVIPNLMEADPGFAALCGRFAIYALKTREELTQCH